MRVLVTGAAGCLGRYIANDFARRGFEVICVYRNRKPIVLAGSHIRLIQSDLSKGLELPDRYDAVFHAAASSPGPNVFAADMALNNVEATRHLVAHSLRAGANHFVFCSSISIYGNITVDEVDERTSVCDPDIYGLTKLVGEALVAEAAPKLSSLSLRLPAVLGPGATRNVLAVTAAKLQANEPVEIFNPDATFNNAVHCADIAAFVATALNNSWQRREALVLGAGGLTTIRAAIERLRDKLGSHSQIIIREPPKRPFILQSSRAIQHFGYSPMPIDAMLDQFADDVLSDKGSNYGHKSE